MDVIEWFTLAMYHEMWLKKFLNKLSTWEYLSKITYLRDWELLSYKFYVYHQELPLCFIVTIKKLSILTKLKLPKLYIAHNWIAELSYKLRELIECNSIIIATTKYSSVLKSLELTNCSSTISYYSFVHHSYELLELSLT